MSQEEKKPHIVVLDGHCSLDKGVNAEELYTLGQVTYYDSCLQADTAEIIRRIEDATCVLLNKTPLTREVFAACPQIVYVGLLSTGYNVVDVEAAKEYGVTVTNVPVYGTEAVAQFTFALLLELTNRVGYHNQLVHDGAWAKDGYFSFWEGRTMELQGKTMGILGFGHIGQAVGRLAKAFGMQVLAWDNHPTAEGAALATYVDLDTLFARADVVSLHCPLNQDTAKLINQTTVAKMKKGAILLNTSRGGLVEHQALAEALTSGKLAGAGLDVTDPEPIPDGDVLLSAPNCVITSHMAWAAVESRQRLANTAFANMRAFFAGKPENVVS